MHLIALLTRSLSHALISHCCSTEITINRGLIAYTGNSVSLLYLVVHIWYLAAGYQARFHIRVVFRPSVPSYLQDCSYSVSVWYFAVSISLLCSQRLSSPCKLFISNFVVLFMLYGICRPFTCIYFINPLDWGCSLVRKLNINATFFSKSETEPIFFIHSPNWCCNCPNEELQGYIMIKLQLTFHRNYRILFG